MQQQEVQAKSNQEPNWQKIRSNRFLTDALELLDFSNPKPDQITLRDLAVGMGKKLRFGGHHDPFTVAEHCVLVWAILISEGADPATCLAGLLHDASEAYIVDLPTALKDLLPAYKKIEEAFDDAILARVFGSNVPEIDWKAVKRADQYATAIEIYTMIDRDELRHFPITHVIPEEEALGMYTRALKEVRKTTVDWCPRSGIISDGSSWRKAFEIETVGSPWGA